MANVMTSEVRGMETNIVPYLPQQTPSLSNLSVGYKSATPALKYGGGGGGSVYPTWLDVGLCTSL